MVRPLREPVLDHLVQASVDAAGGEFDPETGHYAHLVYEGCASPERAKEIAQALYRAAKRMGYSMSCKVGKSSSANEWNVEFFSCDKAMARAYVLKKYGSDVTRWPYSPRKGDPNYDA